MNIVKKYSLLLFLFCTVGTATENQAVEEDFQAIHKKTCYLLSRKFVLKAEDLFKDVLALDKKFRLSESDLAFWLKNVPVADQKDVKNVTIWVNSQGTDLHQALLSAALFPLDFDEGVDDSPIAIGKDHNIKQLVYSACYGNPDAISTLDSAAGHNYIKPTHSFYKSFQLICPSLNQNKENFKSYQKYSINCADFIDMEKTIQVHKEYVKWGLIYNELYEGEDSRRYFEEIGEFIEETLTGLRGTQAGQSESIESRKRPNNNINVTKTNPLEQRVRIKYSAKSKKMLNKKTDRTLSKGKTNVIIPVNQSTARRLDKKEDKEKF